MFYFYRPFLSIPVPGGFWKVGMEWDCSLGTSTPYIIIPTHRWLQLLSLWMPVPRLAFHVGSIIFILPGSCFRGRSHWCLHWGSCHVGSLAFPTLPPLPPLSSNQLPPIPTCCNSPWGTILMDSSQKQCGKFALRWQIGSSNMLHFLKTMCLPLRKLKLKNLKGDY